MKNLIKGIVSAFFFLLGLLILGLEIIALIDPVGTKMADDGDPFGNPYQPWYVHASMFAFVFICFLVGYILAKSSNNKEIDLR